MIKQKIHFITVLLAALFLSLGTYAQKDSLQVIQLKGKDYYIHQIKKGETLYGIHKLYNVPIEVIKKENPSVNDGLSLDEKLFIPLKKNQKSELNVDGNFIQHKVQKQQTLYAIAKLYNTSEKDILSANPELINGLQTGDHIRIPVARIKEQSSLIATYMHLVQPGETLYSLTKKYKISEDSLLILNNGLPEGLKAGEFILLPEKKEASVKQDIAPVLIAEMDSAGIKSEYHIGVLLPFYLEKNEVLWDHQSAGKRKSIYPQSRFAIEFYNGMLAAIDTINTDSIEFKLHVYDTKGNDSLATDKLLLKEELKEFDLIVGPLYTPNFNKVANFAKMNGVPVVSPVKLSNKLLLGNNHVFKVIPSITTVTEKLATLAVDSFRMDNLIAIRYPYAKEKSMVDAFNKNYAKKVLIKEDSLMHSTINVLEINTNFHDIGTAILKDKRNVLFVPTENRTFVTNLFSYLANLLHKPEYEGCEIVLLGLEKWSMFSETIDLDYFEMLNVHIPIFQYVDYHLPSTKEMIKKYVDLTKTYPTKNAFLGYDLMQYFGNNLKQLGSLNSSFLKQQISTGIDFVKTGIESGYENRHLFIAKFSNYEFVLIRP